MSIEMNALWHFPQLKRFHRIHLEKMKSYPIWLGRDEGLLADRSTTSVTV